MWEIIRLLYTAFMDENEYAFRLMISILFVSLFVFCLLIWVSISQTQAKRQAKEMLERGEVDEEKVDKVLRTLSRTKDHEGKRLFDRLSDLAGR